MTFHRHHPGTGFVDLHHGGIANVIATAVIELEDRTVTLEGTVQAQYTQWRELLHQIYEQERVTP